MEPSITRPKNLTGFEWIDGIYDEKSVGSEGLEALKGVLLSDLPLITTKLRDFSARKSIPAHLRAVAHLSRRDWAPETVEDIKLISSMKALIKGRDNLLEVIKLGAGESSVYSRIILMPAKNKIMDRVQPAKIPLRCWCQLLGANSENDLL